MSGVRIRQDGGMSSNVTIMLNGIGGKGVRIFIDDIPADLLGSGMAMNNLPINILDHIEVYKGYPIKIWVGCTGRDSFCLHLLKITRFFKLITTTISAKG